MKPDWKDVGIRALKTFIQAFGGAIVTLFASDSEVGSALSKTAIIGALAAAA